MKLAPRITAFVSSIVFAASPMAATAKGLIRDAETEHVLRTYSNPIFDAAGIPPEDVRILIVNDPSINAFVAGGLNVFVHTGLITAANKPGMLIGAIAHETGHIAGAHLSQLGEKSDRSTLGSVIGALVGAAVMVGGGGKAGAGVLVGSQTMAQRTYASGIRMNEQAADQAAVGYMDENDISSTGMLEMFETLRRKEATVNTQSDPFLRDHPLTTERITAMRNHIADSGIPKDQVPAGYNEMHARMLAKLSGFLMPYDTVISKYPLSDTSAPARYARAIADFKRNKLTDALAAMDKLIAEEPKNAFYYDTKGQMLFENGRLNEAAASYAKASELMPGSAIILTDYARCFTAQEDKRELLPKAITLLEKSKELDDSYNVTWRELAIAYGRQGKMGQSYLALAEEAALGGNYKTVLQHTSRARQYAKDDSMLNLRIDDLEHDAKAQLKQQKQKGLFD